MKKINSIVLFAIGILITSCSTGGDDLNEIPEANKKYLKSVSGFTDSDYDHFFKYSEGFLTLGSGYYTLNGTYEYDSEGKLTGKSVGIPYTYQYDDQNRVTRQNRVDSNDYIKLTYEQGRVITEQLLELRNGEGDVTGEVLGTWELKIDARGRIIKVTVISIVARTQYGEEERGAGEYDEYEYDAKGNIITHSHYGNSEETVIHLTYDDKINPYYVAFEKYYDSAYYVEFFSGLRIDNAYGLTPNNIISRGDQYTVMEYDEDNYPKSWQKFYGGGAAYDAELFLEYYE